MQSNSAMPLTLALLFHFNQHLSEHAALASRVCYQGLLETLRARPAIKANIHISGTLLHALQWLDPEPLELVRDGLAEGQFELLGSAYAQNVLYASDDWDNRRQIELHRRVLHDAFGVAPVAFWNVERCWRQSLLPLISAAGYHTVLVEDHILEASGAPGAFTYATRSGPYILKLVRDDEALKQRFNFAAWFGRSGGLHACLDRVLQGGGQYLAYAEDAEAMGLWGYSHGVIPGQTWELLGKVLDELAARPDLETGLLSEAPAAATERSPLTDGSASWMEASLASPGLPYHEDGYRSWFDFNARSPKLAEYRRKHTAVRRQLVVLEAQVAAHPGGRALWQAALHTFLSHQYEFGCIGIGGPGYRGWEGMQAALVLARAAELASQGKTGRFVEDLNGDGTPEACLSDGRSLIVTTPLGGRLLYWIDLATGRQLLGNPLAVGRGEHQGDAALPPIQTCPEVWLPDGRGYPAESLVEETLPTRLERYLPEWIWEGEAGPFTLAAREMKLPGERPCLPIQRRGFVDQFWLEDCPSGLGGPSRLGGLSRLGGFALEAGALQELSPEAGALGYRRELGAGLRVDKVYRLGDRSVEVVYRLANASQQAHQLVFESTSELCLDYAALIRHGRRALDFGEINGFPGVVNPLSGEGLYLQADRPWSEVIRREGLLALEVGLVFELVLAAGEVQALHLSLALEEAEENNPLGT